MSKSDLQFQCKFSDTFSFDQIKLVKILKSQIMTNNNIISKAITVVAISFFFSPIVAHAQKFIRVSSSVTIESTIDEVYDVLRSMDQFNAWSPFVVEDPKQINYVEGKDGEIGSTFYWEGVEEKSLGTQTLTDLKQNQYIRLECDIQKPFKGQPLFEYHLKQTENGVLVTQNFEVGMGTFSYIMAKIFGAKGDIQKTNELGLARLKEYVETKEVTIVAIEK